MERDATMTLLQTIQSLERRAESLEQEAAELRRALHKVAHDLAQPDAVLATRQIDGQTIEVTQGDVEAVRARMNRPHPENVLREVAVAYKIAEQSPHEVVTGEAQELLDLIEAYRQEVVAQGLALDDDELEAFLRGD